MYGVTIRKYDKSHHNIYRANHGAKERVWSVTKTVGELTVLQMEAVYRKYSQSLSTA